MKSIQIFVRFLIAACIIAPEYFRFRMLKFIRSYVFFLKDFNALNSQNKNPAFTSLASINPQLNDRTESTAIEPIYFYQSAWLAQKIHQNKPFHHYDVGSSVNMLGIISQFVPVTMIDIRPPDVELLELKFKEGTILSLPYMDGELTSLSSICVLEHIGLGRYGDPIDQFGSEKAMAELIRVLALGGNLYITVPVFPENKLFFNAHRAFDPAYIKNTFKELSLIEEKYQVGYKVYTTYPKEVGFGTGYFHFCKKQAH